MNEKAKGEAGQGHPLPDSAEARHEEIPEHLEREKGRGDDKSGRAEPEDEFVNPDGESYGMKRDQAAHQDQGQSYVDDPDR